MDCIFLLMKEKIGMKIQIVMRFTNLFSSSYSSSDSNYYKIGKSKLCRVLLVIQTAPNEKKLCNQKLYF